MIQFRSNYSFNVLLRLIFLSLIALVIIFYNYDYLERIYFRNQLTYTGYVTNGFILGLFLLGMVKLVLTLLYYWKEERAVGRFIVNVRKEKHNFTENISERSLVYHRYRTMQEIYRQHAPVNQSALAATMVATESVRLSLPRFISNILILTGVFGTIISLSLALTGASSLMHSTNNITSMGEVIHGMSTALSTTTTAIVCYLFFGYFYLKLTDIQTQLFSAIEQITTQYLMPRFTHQTENMIHQVAELVKSLRHTAANMQLSQQQYLEVAERLNELTLSHDERIEGMAENMNQIRELLREGFRLPPEVKPSSAHALTQEIDD